jgi:oxygen-independent coproporphyrinogen-3 oxidase
MLDPNLVGSRMEWTWGRGPLLNNQFPWHYPQPHTTTPIAAANVWAPREPLALYLHTPFCRERCDYCSYATAAHHAGPAIERYVESLAREILMCAQIPGLQASLVNSVYFGGGSPSLLSCAAIKRLSGLVRDNFRLSPDAEISIEMNPCDVEPEKLNVLRKCGFNRISVGVQSFAPGTLTAMRRAHDRRQAVEAIRTVREFGFSNVNLDLIYAYPGQTLEELESNVEQAIRLDPHRISCASLSVFPKTELAYKLNRGLARLPAEDAVVGMVDLLIDQFTQAGYNLDTILCFAKPGTHFVQEEDVLLRGVALIGMGLSSFSLTKGWIYVNTNSFKEYYEAIGSGSLPIARGRPLDCRMRMAMSVIQGLRFLTINRSAFRARFGVDVEQVWGDKLERLERAGLLTRTDLEYRLTPEGVICVGPIMREFYGETPVFHQTFQGELAPPAKQRPAFAGAAQ